MTAATNKQSEIRLSSLIASPFMEVHRDIKRGEHSEYWLRGGRGSTKSSFISIELILLMLKNPEVNAIIYRMVAGTLRESVYEQVVWAIDQLNMRPWFTFRVSPLEIRYNPTGQRILFRGADDPMKSKSIKLSKGYFGILWFEELAEFRGMDDIRTIKASIIRGGDRAITFCSYNPPQTARNWVNKEAITPKPNRMVHSSTYLDVPPAWLGQEFIAEAEALRDSNERAYRHMYLGEVTGTGSQVFDNLTIRTITQDEISHFGATYAGLDFGWYPDPLHFVRCAYAPASRRLWVYDEYRTVKTTNRDVYDQLVKLHGLSTAEEVIADSAELKSVADMRSYGMRCVGATKGPGSVRAGLQWLQGLAEIIIDPGRCPATVQEFSAYEYETDRSGEPVDAYPDHDNHSIDAVRYALNRVWMRKGA